MRKKKILFYSVMSLMVLLAFFNTSQSYAYWSNINLNDISNQSTTIGEWTQIFQWDPNTTYLVGDLVTNNGVTYQAKKDSPTRQPGVSNGWTSEWTAL